MKLNYREILASWNPWHLRKRIAKLESEDAKNIHEIVQLFMDNQRLEKENQQLQSENEVLEKKIQRLKGQQTANYTGLMTECEQLKQEIKRLKEERRWFIYVFELYKFIEQDEMKGDTHEQK